MAHPAALFALLLGFMLASCAHEASVPKVITRPTPPKLVRVGEAELDDQLTQLPRAEASWYAEKTGAPRLYVLDLGPLKSPYPPLVLLHGIGRGGIKDFLPVLGALSRERRILIVDLPGFGHSDRNDDLLTPEGTVRCVAAVVSALQLRRIDLLGHSSGAALAILMAAEHPELVRRMILVAVVGVLRPETLLRSQLHEHLNGMREDRPRAAKVVERGGDALVNTMAAILPSAQAVSDSGVTGRSPSILLATSLLDYNFALAIAAVRSPSMLLWGERDDVAPVRVGHFLDDRLPRSELRFIRDGGHVLMDDQPALLVQDVNDYLDAPLKPEPAPDDEESQKVARCDGQKDWTLSGDFDEIHVDHCEHAWLNRVRARRIVVHDSDLRIDHADVSEGVTAKDSKLVITGGEFHGNLALDLDGGSHDIAGALVSGDEAAVRARERTDVLFSVTRIESKRGTRFAHEAVTLKDGQEL